MKKHIRLISFIIIFSSLGLVLFALIAPTQDRSHLISFNKVLAILARDDEQEPVDLEPPDHVQESTAVESSGNRGGGRDDYVNFEKSTTENNPVGDVEKTDSGSTSGNGSEAGEGRADFGVTPTGRPQNSGGRDDRTGSDGSGSNPTGSTTTTNGSTTTGGGNPDDNGGARPEGSSTTTPTTSTSSTGGGNRTGGRDDHVNTGTANTSGNGTGSRDDRIAYVPTTTTSGSGNGTGGRDDRTDFSGSTTTGSSGGNGTGGRDDHTNFAPQTGTTPSSNGSATGGGRDDHAGTSTTGGAQPGQNPTTPTGTGSGPTGSTSTESGDCQLGSTDPNCTPGATGTGGDSQITCAGNAVIEISWNGKTTTRQLVERCSSQQVCVAGECQSSTPSVPTPSTTPTPAPTNAPTPTPTSSGNQTGEKRFCKGNSVWVSIPGGGNEEDENCGIDAICSGGSCVPKSAPLNADMNAVLANAKKLNPTLAGGAGNLSVKTVNLKLSTGETVETCSPPVASCADYIKSEKDRQETLDRIAKQGETLPGQVAQNLLGYQTPEEALLMTPKDGKLTLQGGSLVARGMADTLGYIPAVGEIAAPISTLADVGAKNFKGNKFENNLSQNATEFIIDETASAIMDKVTGNKRVETAIKTVGNNQVRGYILDWSIDQNVSLITDQIKGLFNWGSK